MLAEISLMLLLKFFLLFVCSYSLLFFFILLLCLCGRFRLTLCQLIDARSVIEIKLEFYAAWKNMAQVLMSTVERR